MRSGHKEWKTNVYGQCKSWLDGGLQPRAVSRDLDWGIPVPVEGAEGKVLYVWFDAPIGYISATKDLTPDWERYCRAFVQNQRAVNILFSGSRQGVFANSIEQGLRKRVAELDPTFTADPRRGIVLSFCVQGCFYAFTNNSGRMDEAKLVALLAEIAKAAQKIEL